MVWTDEGSQRAGDGEVDRDEWHRKDEMRHDTKCDKKKRGPHRNVRSRGEGTRWGVRRAS